MKIKVLVKDDHVLIAMPKKAAEDISGLLYSHVAGEFINLDNYPYQLLRSLESANIQKTTLFRDVSESQRVGHAVLYYSKVNPDVEYSS